MKVTIIDYGRGNLRSVHKAMEKVGLEVVTACEPSQIEASAAIILPGVGAFGDAISQLRARGLDRYIIEWVTSGKPFFGICLGYQLLFSSSEESPCAQGLNLIPGRVIKFSDRVGRIPHMGWNQVRFTQGFAQKCFGDVSDSPYFYHVHSFYPVLEDVSMASAWTDYDGIEFASGISFGNIHAFQFHPEKSQDNGLRLLEGFARSLKAGL